MRTLLYLPVFIVCICSVAAAQISSDVPAEISLETSATKAGMEFMLRFLASDELRGRMTGEQGNDVAARFIAEAYRMYGVSEFEEAPGYLQPVPVKRYNPAESASVQIGSKTFTAPGQLLVMNGQEIQSEAEFIFAGHGLSGDWEGIDASGRIVVLEFGRPGQTAFRGYQQTMNEKLALAAEHGALAVIEFFNGSASFDQISAYQNRPRYILDDPETQSFEIPYLLIDNTGDVVRDELLRTNGNIRLHSTGHVHHSVSTHNVAGFVQGTDPGLNDEYIILMAHFDHIGVQRGPLARAMPDTVFNGARDNAMGTVALLSAARSIAANPTPRSVIFLAVTAEEVGLTGSRYYTRSPLVPLEQTVFVLNSDGAGYTDTSIVTVVGLDRTTAGDIIRGGTQQTGLEAIGDPVPQQNLFDRSDNVNFARLGIPAPTYSPGFRDFGPELMRTYHTVEDRPEDVDFEYLYRFSLGYVYAARGVASMQARPRWTEGDIYEEAYDELYGIEID
jgi:hypothetical protein